jgi:hypothetical protein
LALNQPVPTDQIRAYFETIADRPQQTRKYLELLRDL